MRRRKDMRGPGPLYIRCIFIIIAQLQHYLMPPCLLRSPPAPVGLGRSAPPPGPPSAPAIISGDSDN